MTSFLSFGAAPGLPRAIFLPLLAASGMMALGCVDATASDADEVDEAELAAEDGKMAVARHGRLRVSGSHLVDESGAQVQFKGMSLFWSQWSGQFWNSGAVGTLVDDWNSGLVRAAMGIEMGGYLENPEAEKARVKTIVDAAVAKGVYVIIDWHDHNAPQHTEQAKSFFAEMAKLYRNTPNVLFEVFNEPEGESWGEVKRYAEQVIGAIRGEGAENVVIVGTPTWSQDVDQAANDPITRFENVAYTLHFYAGSHKQSLRDKASYALSKGIALVVTEWGTCDASGNGGLDLNESQTWINFMNEHKLSWANWSLNDKAETASALTPGASGSGGWSDGSLTESGRFVKRQIQAGSSVGPISGPDPGPHGGDNPSPDNGTNTGGTFQFSVSPNVNPWWLQVHVDAPGHSVKSVTANVNGQVYSLELKSWGDWAMSPPSPVPGGTRVIFTARDEQNRQASFTSQPWPG